MAESILMAWIGVGLSGLAVGITGVVLAGRRMARVPSEPSVSDELLEAA